MFEDKWQEKQRLILPGKATCASKRIQGPFMGDMAHPPPGYSDMDFLGGPSRKRKLTALGSRESTPEYFVPRKSSVHESCQFMGLNGQGNNHGVYLNQLKSVEPENSRHQLHNQLHYGDDLSATWPTCCPNVHGNGMKKIDNDSYNMPTHFQPDPSIALVKKMPVEETQIVLNQQNDASSVLNQSEAFFLKSYKPDTESPNDSSSIQQLVRFLSNNSDSSLKIPLEIGSSECMKLVQILQQGSNQANKFSDGLKEKSCSKEEYSWRLRESEISLKFDEINNLPHVAPSSLGPSVSTEKNEKSTSMLNGGPFVGAPLGICFDKESGCRDGSHRDENIKLNEMKATQDAGKPKPVLTENKSSDYNDKHEKLAECGQKNHPNHGSFKLNESKLPSEKSGRIAQKLWDGSLQLSSTVTLSAVAYFKSGEKLHGNNWAEFVEVKGKVKLEAFEKYIQDLPRSRNRGLMVVSLCWKEGSSKAGLTGLKEVANGYRKGARVGYAKLSPGTDLYICPRSDAIITILAKYGFFKGMAAIDENRDSMIGCVVWRKNHTSSNSVGKKLDSKNSLSSGEPPNSPTCISVQQGEEKKSSTTKLAQESCQPIGPLAVSSSKLENPGENGTERTNSKTNEDQKVDKSSSDSISLPVASVPSNTLSIPMERVTPADLYSPIHAPISPQTCNLMKRTSHGEDDDLPEFDFGAACGISATPMSQPLNPATDNKVVSLPVISQGSNSMNVGQLPAPPNRRIPFPEPHVRGFAISEEKAGVLVNPNKVPSDESLKKARLFDDDDMPEWCPLSFSIHPCQ